MRVLPGGVLGGYYAPQELAFIVREARGARLVDFSGREYIDYILGSGPLVLGHAIPRGAAVRNSKKGTTYFSSAADEAMRGDLPGSPARPGAILPPGTEARSSLTSVPRVPQRKRS